MREGVSNSKEDFLDLDLIQLVTMGPAQFPGSSVTIFTEDNEQEVAKRVHMFATFLDGAFTKGRNLLFPPLIPGYIVFVDRAKGKLCEPVFVGDMNALLPSATMPKGNP